MDEQIKLDDKIIKVEKTEEGNVSLSLLEEAKKLAGELRAENENQRELIRRREELLIKEMLGGKAEAGKIEKKKELTDEEYTNKFSDGEINLFEGLT